MPGRPEVHVKTRQSDEQNLSEVAIGWKKKHRIFLQRGQS